MGPEVLWIHLAGAYVCILIHVVSKLCGCYRWGYMRARGGESEMVEDSLTFALEVRIWASWALRQFQMNLGSCFYWDTKQREIASVYNRTYAGPVSVASCVLTHLIFPTSLGSRYWDPFYFGETEVKLSRGTQLGVDLELSRSNPAPQTVPSTPFWFTDCWNSGTGTPRILPDNMYFLSVFCTPTTADPVIEVYNYNKSPV